ncbi:MAG TPA: hypothetical protein VJA66_04860 [Thermoanaerobaculia bacterium]
MRGNDAGANGGKMIHFSQAAFWIFALSGGATSSPPAAVPVEKEPFHRPVFTNSEVQVLDVVIPPKTSTLFHTHLHDLLGLTISSAPSKNEVPGQKPTLEPADPEGEVWYEPFPSASTHRVENVGNTPIHYLVFQVLGKAAADAPASAWPDRDVGRVAFENARVRVVRIDLAAGEAAADHKHMTGYGIGTLTGGRLEEDKEPSRSVSEAGFVRWGDRSLHHTIRNAGDAPISIFEFEVRN